MKKIKAIVFDFDDVLHHEPTLFSKKFSQEYHLPYDLVLKFFTNELVECQKGKMDMKEVLKKKYLPKWGWKRTTDDFCRYWFEYGKINSQLLNKIKRIRETGILTALSTRNEKYRIDYMRKKFKLVKIFNRFFGSCNLGYRKPDIRAYKKIVQLLDFKPQEILIVDDTTELVEIPKKLGLQSLLYKNNSQFIKDLAKFGIKV